MNADRHLNPDQFGKEFDPTTFTGYKDSEYNYGAYLKKNTRAGNRIDRKGYRDYSHSANSLGQDDADLYERGGEPREHFSGKPTLQTNQTHFEAHFLAQAPVQRNSKNS